MFVRVLAILLAVLAPSAAIAQTETVYYFHTDAIGSVRMITDANGQEVARQDYLPFGEEWAGTSYSNIENRMKFAGLERDAETGLDYAMARYYRYQSGRFTQADDPAFADPLAPQTSQLYGYAYNNPMQWVDPTGHAGECPYDVCVKGKDPLKELMRWVLQNDFYESLFRPVIFPETPAELAVSLGVTTLATGGVGLPAAGGRAAALIAAMRLGRAGQAAVGAVANTQRIASATGTAAYRIPDVLNHAARVVGEVKNVRSLSYSNQLRDFAAYARQTGYTFELWVRPTTQLSGPLQQAVSKGEVVLRFIP